MRFRLRTLLIVLGVAPALLAIAWWNLPAASAAAFNLLIEPPTAADVGRFFWCMMTVLYPLGIVFFIVFANCRPANDRPSALWRVLEFAGIAITASAAICGILGIGI